MNKQEKTTIEAALWAVRVEAGLDNAGQDAFLAWLAADPRHGAAYERQRANWDRLDAMAAWRPARAAEPDMNLMAPARVTFSEWARAHWRALAGGALGAACAAACAALALVALHPSASTKTPPGASAPARFAYAANSLIPAIEQSTFEDGTIVELNRGTSLAVNYTPEERHVKLNQGEVNFYAERNPARPFVVDVDGVRLDTPGTRFNVRRDGGSVVVLVLSGAVRMRANPDWRAGAAAPGAEAEAGAETTVETVAETAPAPETIVVEAGQMAVVSKGAWMAGVSVQTVAPDEMKNLTAWHPRMLDINGQTLSSVVEEFNKCNAPFRLVIADPELEKTKVTAILRSDQVENLLRLLEQSFRVKAERAGDVVTLSRMMRI